MSVYQKKFQTLLVGEIFENDSWYRNLEAQRKPNFCHELLQD